MKYSLEIGFNGIITPSLTQRSRFPHNQTISISTEYPGTKIKDVVLSNNINKLSKILTHNILVA